MKHVRPFLQTIALQYAAKYRDLSRFCFIFPGKRSGTFFLKYLRGAIGGRYMIAPQTLTISDFTSSLCGNIVDNRIDMIFLLYRCYLKIKGYHDSDTIPEEDSFDTFYGWGETVLSDFNDIDNHMVHPDELFKNLRDFNEISANFLTEEQKEVMETYFNIRQPEASAERFWKTFAYKSQRDDEVSHNQTEIKKRFVYLWQLLAPLYHEFNAELDREGLTYPGKAALRTLEFLRAKGREGIEPVKVVFVGFNVLTTVEWRIFREMQRMRTVIAGHEEPLADFIWDLTGPVLDDEHNSAARFVRKGIAQFPKPDWLSLEEADTSRLPADIHVISSPSNVMQAKIAGYEVGALHSRLQQTEFDEARIAVVLPDEGLLIPMIHSLPDTMIEEEDPDNKSERRRRRSIGVNLTMGLPLRHTPVVSFISILRRVHTRLRRDSGGTVYFHQDVEALLAHTFTHILLGSSTVMTIAGMIKESHMRYIDASTLQRFSPESGLLFAPLAKDAGVDEVIDYLDRLLDIIDNKSIPQQKESDTADPTPVTMESLTHTHIDTYRRALVRLRQACLHRDVIPSVHTLFMLADRLVAGEKVMFEGEPLHGLQIMGLLETRSLDFDHIIIPSMNERIFPRRMRQRTFIPDSLRTAFGLPTAYSQESIFAYYFYRLICRAKSVTLIYDARNGATHSGDPSRFILQLKYLYGKGMVRETGAHFALHATSPDKISIPKDSEQVKEQLQMFLASGGCRRLSASSMQKYLQCPVQFYFSYLAGVNVEPKPTEFMSPLELGDIVHHVMMHVYLDRDNVQCLLPSPHPVRKRPDSETIRRLVHEAVNVKYLHRDAAMPLYGEPAIQAELITPMVTEIVDMDMSYDALEILGTEIPVNIVWPLKDGRKVNFTMTIDRLDCVTDRSGRRRYRIVDYKTGSVSVTAKDAETIFTCDHDTKYFFQLMLYSALSHRYPQLAHISEFSPVIYDMNGRAEVFPKIGKTEIASDMASYTDAGGEVRSCILTDFEEILDARLVGLFDTDTPFEQTADNSVCAYCDFRSICRR